MISLSQIKAARALLNWTQDNLAKAAGLSLPAINNLERGLTSPRRDTLSAIENALSEAGIDFIETTGVKLRTPDVAVEIIEGPDFLKAYDEDIFSNIKGDDIIRTFSSDDRPWMIYGPVTNHLYQEHKKKIGFTDRLLAPNTCDFITCEPQDYRLLDPSFFDGATWQVYADRVAHIIWPARKVILNKSRILADSFRVQFDALWQQGKPFTPAQVKKLERWRV
jgi:transcriptional regulator with XRE-family HTH domain